MFQPCLCNTVETRSYTADAVWYRQPSGQPTNTVMLNLNWLRVEEVSWQWSVGCVTVPRLSKWYDVTWCDMAWRDMTGQDVTWRDITWYGMTWHGVAWRDIRYMTWHDVTWRDMTLRDVTFQDVWSLSQRNKNELYYMWDGCRYCQKTIKTFLGLNLFTDI